MRYRDLLTNAEKFDFGEVGRFKTEGLEVATIASLSDPPMIPFAFPNYPLILENGDDSEIDDEAAEALLRWIMNQQKHG